MRSRIVPITVLIAGAVTAPAIAQPPPTLDLIRPRYYALPVPTGVPEYPQARLAQFGLRPFTRDAARHGYPLPLATRTAGTPVRVFGKYVSVPGGEPMSGLPVQAVDPRGQQVGTATTDHAGNFSITFKPTAPGRHTFALIAAPQVGGQVTIRLRRGVTISGPRRVARNRSLIVNGNITPGQPGKLVTLEYRDGRTWRPITTRRTGPSGTFRFTYRPRRTRGFATQLRVVAPAEARGPLLRGVSKTLSTKVL